MSNHPVPAALLLFLAVSLAAQSVTVTAPNGGESWALGSPHAITWSFQNAGAVKVTLILRNSGGVVGTIKSNVELASGSWLWASVGRLEDGTVVAPGGDYIVRVRDAGNTFGDNSDGRFAISALLPPGITVTRPNGGEEWPYLNKEPVNWDCAGLPATTPVKMLLYGEQGEFLCTILPNLAAGQGSYLWTVGTAQGMEAVPYRDRYRIRVATLDGATFGQSAGTFRILPRVTPPAIPRITVVNPSAGGESMVAGHHSYIHWTVANISQNVRIALVTPDGAGVGVIAENIGAQITPYLWTVGQTQSGTAPAGASYKVRVATMDGSVQDMSDNPFTIQEAPKPAILRAPSHDRVPSLFPKPRLEVTAIGLVRNAGGYGIVFGYKNAGDGPLPRRSELTAKPDYRVLIDDREVDKGDLFIPESPPAGPGWEMTTFSGGSIQFPANEPRPWNIGDRITILLNERNALNMGAASKTSALRLIALTAGYDLAFAGPAAIDWSASKARVTITKVGSPAQNSRKIVLSCGIGYTHKNTMGGGGANEAVVYVPSGPYRETRTKEFPIAGPFPLHWDLLLDPTSPYYELEFHIRTDGRDQFDERNDDLPPARFERPGIPPGPRIHSVSFSPYNDAKGEAKLRTVIALRNGSGQSWGGLHLVMKRNGSKVGEWQGFGLGAGAGSTVNHVGPPAGANNIFNFYLYDAGNNLIDSRQEIHY
jgi:hypothetical protein